MRTHDQRMAETAFGCFNNRKTKEYCSFAKSFPSVIHSCGLAQAVAFAKIRNEDYLIDLQKVLTETDEKFELEKKIRSVDSIDYIRISRRAISAASWIKRYAQALETKEKKPEE